MVVGEAQVYLRKRDKVQLPTDSRRTGSTSRSFEPRIDDRSSNPWQSLNHSVIYKQFS